MKGSPFVVVVAGEGQKRAHLSVGSTSEVVFFFFFFYIFCTYALNLMYHLKLVNTIAFASSVKAYICLCYPQKIISSLLLKKTL